MTLQTFSIAVDIVSSVAVFAAIIFGVTQIRQYRQQRRDMAAIELVRSVQDHEFTNGYRLIHVLPEGISAADFRALGSEHIKYALAVGMKYETIGLLVFKGVIPLSIVEELVGGVAIVFWRRLSPWVEAMRKEQSSDFVFEWFEWLVDLLVARGRDVREPANKQYTDWGGKYA